MFSIAAIACLCLGAAMANVSLVLGAPVVLAGFGFAAAAFRRPGDMEWMLGLFVLAGIGFFFVQLGAAFGLWGL